MLFAAAHSKLKLLVDEPLDIKDTDGPVAPAVSHVPVPPLLAISVHDAFDAPSVELKCRATVPVVCGVAFGRSSMLPAKSWPSTTAALPFSPSPVAVTTRGGPGHGEEKAL